MIKAPWSVVTFVESDWCPV
uniref:Uncharacterized protein n=1 Tax=Anguilla anguilla TaxID=7936 RepID=A0A0E9S5H5_ANGAN